mgnify:CR=1 FL=1
MLEPLLLLPIQQACLPLHSLLFGAVCVVFLAAGALHRGLCCPTLTPPHLRKDVGMLCCDDRLSSTMLIDALLCCPCVEFCQCAAVALKLYNTLEVDDTISDDSMQDLYQLYTLMLGGTFAVLTLGMGMSGVWLRRRLNQQISDYNQWEARHSYNPVSMPHRLPNPEARFSTAAAALAPDPLSDLWREPHEDPQAVLSPVRTDAAHWHGRADSTDDDDHPRRSRKFQLPMKTTTLFRDKFKGKGDVGTPSKAASSHNAKPARQRTTSLLRSALRHLAFIQVVCVLLFAMIAFLNVISPSLSIEREHGGSYGFAVAGSVVLVARCLSPWPLCIVSHLGFVGCACPCVA